MANWCECTLEVSGENENMKRFLLEVFICPERRFYCLVDGDENSLTIKLPKKHVDSYFYVRGSQRNFVFSREIKWDFSHSVLIIENYNAAWCIDPNFIASISKEYQVHLRIHGYEEMGSFKVDVEVCNGVIEKSELIEFGSYDEFLQDSGFED